MSNYGSRTPITTALGYQAVTLWPSGWKKLSAVMTIPPDATGALINVHPGSQPLDWMQAVDAIPLFPFGLLVDAGQFLTLDDFTQIQQFCVNTDQGTSFGIQFFTGPVGSMPAVTPKQIGGGGGGTVTDVIGLLPITSTGGTTPGIGLHAADYPNQLMIWNGSNWTYVNAVRNNVIWVDQLSGNDATGQINEFLFPFATINAAVAAAEPGFLIYVSPGTYTEDIGLVDLVNYYFSPGTEIIGRVHDVTPNSTICIYGYGTFLNNGNTVEITQANSVVKFIAKSIQTSGALNAAFRVTSPTAIVSIECSDVQGQQYGLQLTGTVNFTGNITASNIGATISAGETIIRGNIRASSGLGISGGSVSMYGDIYANLAIDVNSGATCLHVGNADCPSNVKHTSVLEINGKVTTTMPLLLFNTAKLILCAGTRLVIGAPSTVSIGGPAGTEVTSFNSFSTLPPNPAILVNGLIDVQPWVE